MSGMSPDRFLGNWLLITAALFAVSALWLVVRTVRARRRARNGLAVRLPLIDGLPVLRTGVPEQGGDPGTGPEEVRRTGGLPAVVEAYLDLLVHLVGRGLRDEQAPGCQYGADPAEQGLRVAADADVAVDEQGGPPAAFPGQRLEHAAAERLPPIRWVRPMAASLTSIPSARCPRAASAATSRPGPQPMSMTGPSLRRSADRSAASASAHQRSTSSGRSHPSFRRRKSGPRPRLSARAYGSVAQAAGPAGGSTVLIGPPPGPGGRGPRRTGRGARRRRRAGRRRRCPRRAAAAGRAR